MLTVFEAQPLDAVYFQILRTAYVDHDSRLDSPEGSSDLVKMVDTYVILEPGKSFSWSGTTCKLRILSQSTLRDPNVGEHVGGHLIADGVRASNRGVYTISDSFTLGPVQESALVFCIL